MLTDEVIQSNHVKNGNPGTSFSSIEKGISFEYYIEMFSEFDHVKRAYTEAKESDTGFALLKQKYDLTEVKFSKICEEFEKENGRIVNRYICGNSKAAVMLCRLEKSGKRKKPEHIWKFFTQYKLGNNPRLEKLLIDIEFLAAESTRLLKGHDLEKCLRMTYKISKNTLGIIDSKILEESKSKVNETIKVIEENLEKANRYHLRAARLAAQIDYFTGNIGGVGIVIGIVLLSAALLSWINPAPSIISSAAIIHFGLVSGSIGALISVMSRISSRNLELDYEPVSATIQLIGILRPFIGGVFGAILLILVNSSFIMFEMDGISTNTPKEYFNYIILGSLAGFIERFVPDILDLTKNKLVSSSDPNAETEEEKR